MRALVLLAATAVAALAWPRTDGKPRCVMRVGTAAAPVATLPISAHSEPVGATRGAEPPSGVAEGPCTLRLRLLDDATGEPLKTTVDLWRLDLAEDANWTAGDQLHARREVAADGSAFANLPPGLYRLMVHGQSHRAEDPPAFRVSGNVTDRALVVRASRRHSVYLRAFTETGRELREGRLKLNSSSSIDRIADPPWARRRSYKHPRSRNIGIGRGGGVGCGGGARAASWTPRGFAVGRFIENSRRRRHTWRRAFLAPERSVVNLSIDGELAGDRTYLAVAVSVEELADLVFLPDGRRASDAGALFTASSRAIELTPTTPLHAWREIEVTVIVGLVGYDNVELTYRVDRPPAPLGMKPWG
ncbi:MAG: hypothetical protein ACYTDU_06065 [Planctomycetota bacterium]|jgi:hypothetical protein